MPEALPRLIVTVDTEPDDQWRYARSRGMRNLRRLPKFHAFCRSFNITPTYLVTYEVAIDAFFCGFAKEVVQEGSGEIGMHPHAWSTPPFGAQEERWQGAAYFMTELPAEAIRMKLRRLKATIEENFGIECMCHRAGRWAMSATYAQILAEEGISVDCSITPGINWRFTRGARKGGPDYSRVRRDPHPLLEFGGDQGLLEVPVTTGLVKQRPWTGVYDRMSRFLPPVGLLSRLRGARVLWLRPSHGSETELVALAENCIAEGLPHLQIMLHSSELEPGANPYFANEDDVRTLYKRLEVLFEGLRGRVVPNTLSQFAAWWRGRCGG